MHVHFARLAELLKGKFHTIWFTKLKLYFRIISGWCRDGDDAFFMENIAIIAVNVGFPMIKHFSIFFDPVNHDYRKNVNRVQQPPY